MPEGTFPGVTGLISCGPAAYGRESADAIGAKIGGKGAVAITEGNFNSTENMVAESFTARMRAFSIAAIYLFTNLIGAGLGPLAAGTLSAMTRT